MTATRFEPSASSAITQLTLDSPPDVFDNPELVFFNKDLADQFDLPAETPSFYAAQEFPENTVAVAQAYAGHQFGHFNPQLGDGRAHIIADIANANNEVFEFGYKGSGATPFSRGGDGKAALGPMLREVLISEAMHALGISTTRSIAVVKNNQIVFRNPPQPRAILTRIASSHIRVGTFQFFAARGMNDTVEQLIDFCLSRHYANVEKHENKALNLLYATVERQAELIAQWMSVGFIHGVMNTDNMLISGETIDYGPCAFMESYNPKAIYSSIDEHGRYAYINQPGVAQWNLSRFAETLLSLIDEDKEVAIELATEAVKSFGPVYAKAYRARMSAKLGIDTNINEDVIDALIDDWLTLLHENELDFTISHRKLSQAISKQELFLDTLPKGQHNGFESWLQRWQEHLSPSLTPGQLDAINPAVTPRNHLVEEALTKAWQDEDYSLFNDFLESLKSPFEVPKSADFSLPAPKGFDEEHVTFCGT